MRENTPPICDYEGSDYQQRFWDEGGRSYEDAVEAIALKRLLPSSGEFMLELGAGAGRNTLRYKRYERIALLDYSRTQLIQARERLGESSRFLYVAADVYKLPFVSGLFDSATMIRTLHHMADPELALTQVARVMSPDGVFILEFANKRNFKAMLRYMFGKQSWSPYSHEPVEFAALNFDFHPQAVRGYLHDAGFRIERQLSVSHFRVGFLKKHFPLKLLVGLDSFLQHIGGIIQISPSVFSRCCVSTKKNRADPNSLFVCPKCQALLAGLGGDLHCEQCGADWPFKDGIYDFRQEKDE
jgi:ubiquinone/menaquinone biosynthesis C-methylase UbiE